MDKMKLTAVMFGILVVFVTGLVSAITPQEIDEAKNLIDSKVDCKSLSDSQLEILGEYYMEQMHPGEAHELMHKMMGLQEGSDTERQFHINMARTMYCGESGGMMSSGGMMGMMGMMMNMMGSGMMGGQNVQGGMMQDTMGNWGYNLGYWGFVNALYVILLIGLTILVYLGIIKLWK